MLDEKTGAPDRFRAPLYTIAETARYLDVPPATMDTWAKGYVRRVPGRRTVEGAPLLTRVLSANRRGPTIPFIGLAEGNVLAAMRRGAGVPLQRIRPALSRLTGEVGVEYALASKRLYTDGAEILFDYAEHDADEVTSLAVRELVVVRSGQRVFSEVVEAYLRRIEFGDDGYARTLHLPSYAVADVLIDPSRAFGQPIFARGGARLEDALSMFRAGEPIEVVREEYRVPLAELEDVIRLATRVSA